MFGSSESWGPQQRPHPWHFRAGGGAVHSIKTGIMQRSKRQKEIVAALHSVTSSARPSSDSGTVRESVGAYGYPSSAGWDQCAFNGNGKRVVDVCPRTR